MQTETIIYLLGQDRNDPFFAFLIGPVHVQVSHEETFEFGLQARTLMRNLLRVYGGGWQYGLRD